MLRDLTRTHIVFQSKGTNVNLKHPVTETPRIAQTARRRFERWTIATLCALSLTGYAASAFAVTDEERAGARAAANAGADAFAEQRWADAITYFEKAESLVHAPPHLLNIARAREKLGQLVEAREAYLKVAKEELASDVPKAFRQAQAEARAELEALEPRVPRVSVVVQGAGELPVRVMMNGSQVPDGLVGVPRPLNPGNYEFQAFAEGARSHPSSLVLRESAKETVVLTLQVTNTAAPAAPAAATTAAATPGTEPQDTGQKGGGPSGMRIASYVSLGVGVVGIGAGTVFALSASSKRSDADDICGPEGTCPENRRDEIEDLDSQADSARTMSIVSFVVGGVGIATGVALFVSSPQKTAGASIRPWIGLNSAGVSGRF